jgi:hypothetical protein
VPVIGALIVGLLVVAGCGGERTFEPEEFADAANAEGAGMTLGDELVSIEEGVDVYAITFAKGPGGSLVVTDDADAAREEHARCEEAVTLVCYRAANVVLMLEGEEGDEHLAKVDAAIRALAAG